jgi:hypothetical protein
MRWAMEVTVSGRSWWPPAVPRAQSRPWTLGTVSHGGQTEDWSKILPARRPRADARTHCSRHPHGKGRKATGPGERACVEAPIREREGGDGGDGDTGRAGTYGVWCGDATTDGTGTYAWPPGPSYHELMSACPEAAQIWNGTAGGEQEQVGGDPSIAVPVPGALLCSALSAPLRSVDLTTHSLLNRQPRGHSSPGGRPRHVPQSQHTLLSRNATLGNWRKGARVYVRRSTRTQRQECHMADLFTSRSTASWPRRDAEASDPYAYGPGFSLSLAETETETETAQGRAGQGRGCLLLLLLLLHPSRASMQRHWPFTHTVQVSRNVTGQYRKFGAGVGIRAGRPAGVSMIGKEITSFPQPPGSR